MDQPGSTRPACVSGNFGYSALARALPETSLLAFKTGMEKIRQHLEASVQKRKNAMSRNMSILAKTLLSLLWLFLVAWAGLYGLFIAVFVGVYLVPLAVATLAAVLAGALMYKHYNTKFLYYV